MIKKEIDQGKRHIISSKLLCGQDANLQVQIQIVCTVKRSLIRKVPPLSVFLLPDQKVQKIQGKNGALSPKIWVPFCCLSPKVPDLAGFFGQVASYLTEIEESVDRAGGRPPARPPARQMQRANRLVKPRPMVPRMLRRPPRPSRGGRHGKSSPCHLVRNTWCEKKIAPKVLVRKIRAQFPPAFLGAVAQNPGQNFDTFVKKCTVCEATERRSKSSRPKNPVPKFPWIFGTTAQSPGRFFGHCCK